MRKGVPIPPPFDDPPTYPYGTEIFVQAWQELNLERRVPENVETVHRIERSQIREWVKDHDLSHDHEFREELTFYIGHIDDAFIPIRRKQQQEARAKADKPSLRDRKIGSRGKQVSP